MERDIYPSKKVEKNKYMKNIKTTNFQKLVWTEIKKIPKGKTMTYKELAIKIGKPKAYRAVANACAKNPSLMTIPWNRVIRSDGKMGGFMGKKGIERKRRLLEKEGVTLNDKNFSDF